MSTNRTIPAVQDLDGMAVIGRTKHALMGIRYADGDGAEAPPVTPPAAPAAPATPTPPPAAPAAPVAPTVPPAPINYKGEPDEYVRELRAENKTAREAREAAEATLATATAEREAAAAERDHLKRENKLILAAPRLGASADLLLDSSSFTKTFAAVDLNDQAAVDKAITDALGKNPAFKAGPALPPSSGGGHQGGTPPASTPTLGSAIAAAYSGK